MCTYNFVTILMAYVIVVTRSIVGEFHLGKSSPQQRHIKFGFIRLASLYSDCDLGEKWKYWYFVLCIWPGGGGEAFYRPFYYKLSGILGVSDKSEIYDDATASTHKN